MTRRASFVVAVGLLVAAALLGVGGWLFVANADDYRACGQLTTTRVGNGGLNGLCTRATERRESGVVCLYAGGVAVIGLAIGTRRRN